MADQIKKIFKLFLYFYTSIFQTAMVIAFRITVDYKLHGKCRMTASNLINHVDSLSGALPKDSPFTKIVENE